MTENPNLKKIAYLTIVIIGGGWLLYIGSSIFLPLIFACLFAIFLMPINKFFRRTIKWKWLSISLSFLTVTLPIVGLFILFSFQIADIIENIPSISDQVEKGIDKILAQINSLNPYKKFKAEEIITSNIDNLSDGPINSIRTGIISTSEILLSLALTFLYTFFILFYKESFKNFVIYQFAIYDRSDIKDTLLKIKDTVQGYISGLGIVILILSTMNSIGLYFIGIDYPIFWGVLAGVLAVIPYVGTFLGGILPFLYSLSTTDTSWQPIAIVVYYGIIQQIEGNFITPQVVGNKVNINPLVAIISLIFFGSFWGIGGIILALPLISVVRIILEQFDETKAIAMLMSANVVDNADKFRNLNADSGQFLLPSDKGYKSDLK